MKMSPVYPTFEHEQCAMRVVDFFRRQPGVEVVTLICSCARGVAVPGSDLDMDVIMDPAFFASPEQASLELGWQEFRGAEPIFQRLAQHGPYADVGVDFIDAQFAPEPRSWTSGPDEFELAIGNSVAYAGPLWERGDFFQRLKAQWLPYYDEALRRERLAQARLYCLNNLGHIPPYVARGLYFQAFNRLYDAIREFIQALFIARRTYPIAYDKWIKAQITELLGLPDLYPQLVAFFEFQQFESHALSQKAERLERLVEKYVTE